MLLPHGTVIAIVDGKEWTLLRNAGNEAEPELVALPLPQLAEANHSGADASHASPHQKDEDAHAYAVADYLNREVGGHKIDRLLVIAPPRTLGELRKHYSKQLEHALIGELSKDLVGRRPDEVLAALRAK